MTDIANELFGSVTDYSRTLIELFHAERGVVLPTPHNDVPTAAAVEILGSEHWTNIVTRGLADSREGRTVPFTDYLASAQ